MFIFNYPSPSIFWRVYIDVRQNKNAIDVVKMAKSRNLNLPPTVDTLHKQSNKSCWVRRKSGWDIRWKPSFVEYENIDTQ